MGGNSDTTLEFGLIFLFLSCVILFSRTSLDARPSQASVSSSKKRRARDALYRQRDAARQQSEAPGFVQVQRCEQIGRRREQKRRRWPIEFDGKSARSASFADPLPSRCQQQRRCSCCRSQCFSSTWNQRRRRYHGRDGDSRRSTRPQTRRSRHPRPSPDPRPRLVGQQARGHPQADLPRQEGLGQGHRRRPRRRRQPRRRAHRHAVVPEPQGRDPPLEARRDARRRRRDRRRERKAARAGFVERRGLLRHLGDGFLLRVLAVGRRLPGQALRGVGGRGREGRREGQDPGRHHPDGHRPGKGGRGAGEDASRVLSVCWRSLGERGEYFFVEGGGGVFLSSKVFKYQTTFFPSADRRSHLFDLDLKKKKKSKNQICAWIHIDDLVSLFVEALANPSYEGAYNGTAPSPVPMAELCSELGATLGRPSWLPVPEFALQVRFF